MTIKNILLRVFLLFVGPCGSSKNSYYQKPMGEIASERLISRGICVFETGGAADCGFNRNFIRSQKGAAANL